MTIPADEDAEEKLPMNMTAVLAETDDPRIQHLAVFPELINDLFRSMVAAGAELNDLRNSALRRRKNRDEELDALADDASDANEPVTCKGARYDGQISIRAREEDVARFQTLADEREWSYGRMFHELLKEGCGQADEV